MNRLEVGLILGVVWTGIVVVALAWLRAAATAGERFDQTITDHHQDGDDSGDSCVITGHSIMHRFGCDFGPDCPGTYMPPHPDAKRLREDLDQ